MQTMPNVCAYCGKEKPETRDHIPPKGCFPEPLPSNLITVPCCSLCHSGWSNDDEYFRTMLLMSQNLRNDPRAMKQLKKSMKALSRPGRRGFARIMGKSLKIATVRTRAGIIVGTQPVVLLDLSRIDKVLSRIIRGLFFKEYLYSLPKDCVVETYLDQFGKRSASIHKDGSFPAPKWAADNMFLYTYQKTQENSNITVWLCAFYEKVSFVGFTGLNYIPDSEAVSGAL